ncbi:hypothetical protein ACFVTY_06895 [Streptomyces sp. NPDC058067]|uniref:hypothetical protein n=1 Tax=Streptomyces sp. NPDC058067 TaxID=3346324 RepID=UPI0036E717CC
MTDRVATIHALARVASRHQDDIVTLVTSTEAEQQLTRRLLGERPGRVLVPNLQLEGRRASARVMRPDLPWCTAVTRLRSC